MGEFRENLRKHPIMRSLRGEKLKVDMDLREGSMVGDSREMWVPLNASTLRHLGYIPAMGYKTGFRDILTPVFIKFNGFEKYPVYREIDGEVYDMSVANGETASTMYDYFASPAIEEFIKSMKAKTVSQMDMKRVVMIVVVAAILGLIAWAFLGGLK